MSSSVAIPAGSALFAAAAVCEAEPGPATPYLIGLRSRAMLQIPVVENIGQLRQTGMPGSGKEYWMVFSNRGNLVRVGDRVNVVIGAFHADNLIVE
jgi:hypothetical protein